METGIEVSLIHGLDGVRLLDRRAATVAVAASLVSLAASVWAPPSFAC
ncbi:MAG: hypothetical protein LBV34_16335 [Nocardiopsaceae bacterium]|nr:hypothetical protein [Nocardiopsaceae bacterium]